MWKVILVLIVLYIVWRRLTKIEMNPADVIFVSSFTRGADPTAKEKIIIDEKYVTWKKNRGWNFLWMSVNSVTLPRANVTGVVVVEKLIGSDVIIMGQGGGNIRATCFRPKDAIEIKQLLTL